MQEIENELQKGSKDSETADRLRADLDFGQKSMPGLQLIAEKAAIPPLPPPWKPDPICTPFDPFCWPRDDHDPLPWDPKPKPKPQPKKPPGRRN